MPSEQEIHDLREQYPDLRVWGATRSGLTHESVLGDFPVVPFDDVIAALRACEQRARKEERGGAPVAAIELAGYSRGYAAGVSAARDAVAEVDYIGYYAEDVHAAILAAIDARRGEQS